MPAQTPLVDVALNVFAKPYQTALSVLSLLRFCRERINTIFFQFENGLQVHLCCINQVS